MKKFIMYLPLLSTAVLGIIGAFHGSLGTYFTGHAKYATYLGLLYTASESLAATTVVKANSVAELLFNFFDGALGALLGKS